MNRLKIYRNKIDKIDRRTVKLLSLRFKLIKKITLYKQRNKLKIIDVKRESQVINNLKKYSKQHQKIVITIFKKIIYYSRRLQK